MISCTHLSFPAPRALRKDQPLTDRCLQAWTAAGAYLETKVSCLLIVLIKHIFWVSVRGIFLNHCDEKVLTTRGFMLPHSGLDHLGFDGTAGALLVKIGAVSSALLVQEGVRWLRALWSFIDAGEGVCSRLSGRRNKCSLTYLHSMRRWRIKQS